MRRKTRPRVIWLPGDPFFSVDAAALGHSTINVARNVVTALSPGITNTIVAPCVKDLPQNPLTPTNSLADIESSGYRLRRIVGSIWVNADQATVDDGRAAIATAGFIVLRVDDATGLPLSPAANDSYNTDIIENQGDPWIWRRSWRIENGLSTTPLAGSNAANGAQGDFLGGNFDGPHVDAKTARVIAQEERLFLCLSTTVINAGSGVQGDDFQSNWVWNCRYLASMRTMSGNRRNASR